MCVKSHSESGQPCGFSPCEAYQRVREYSTNLHDFILWLSQRHAHDGLTKSHIIHMAAKLDVGGKWQDDHVKFDGRTGIEVLEAENAALRKENLRLEFKNEALHKELHWNKATTHETKQENAALRHDRDRLAGVIALADIAADKAADAIEAADALADAIQHASDLHEVADFLRDRIEGLREYLGEQWRIQFDDFNAAVKEMANRRIAFDELYECTEYTSRVDMVKESAKAYQEARHG